NEMPWRKRHSAITFDVGAAGVRVGQVRRHRPQPLLTDALTVELTRGTDAPSTDFELPVPRLARLVGQGRFIGAHVALVLSQPELFFHALRVPAKLLDQSTQQLEDSLRWEIARETRTDAADLTVRHWPLPPGHREGLNVMAVAIQTSRALEWHRAFAEFGLHLRRIDASACGLARLATRDWSPEKDDAWAILDIGLRRTSIAVFVGTTLVYVRSTAVSAHGWTAQLARAFDVSYAEAEQLKRQCGIRTAPRNVRKPSESDVLVSTEELPAVIFGALRDSLDTLIRETNLCLAYVLESYSNVSATHLFLAGGGSALSGLADLFDAQLGLSTLLLSPQSDESSDAHGTQRAASTAAAAAIGGAILDLEAA
ncbi:MAG: hypothetical protein D6744_09680, partial [Planctomycetota bacterium]